MKTPAAPPDPSELHRNRRPFLRQALIVAAYLCTFIILDYFSQQFEDLRGVVAWYPPAGLTYALLLVCGATFTPAVTVALLFSSLFIYQMPQSPYLLLLWALIISLIYGMAAAFPRRLLRFDWQLRKLRDVAWLMVTAVVVSALLAILSVASSALSSDMPRSEVLGAIFLWWIGETVGVLTVTPFLLIHVMPRLKRFGEGEPIWLPVRRPFSRPTLSVVGQALSLALLLYWVFGAQVQAEFRPMYLMTLPLIWIALDRGLKGVTAGIMALNFGVMFATWFFRVDLARLGELQLLMIVDCIVGLLMGAVVTERKRAEEESASLAKYPSEDPNPVLRLSREGIVLDANAAGHTLVGMWGCAVGGLAPQSWRDLVTQVLARRESVSVDVECGGKVYSVFVTPVAGPEYVNLYGSDITERKHAEQMLLESELKFRTIFDHALDGILMVDTETHRCLIGNNAICQMLGYTQDGLSRMGVDDIHPREHLPHVLEQFDRQARGEISLAENIPVKRKDGSVFFADISSTSVMLSGHTYTTGVFRDISERKRAEEEQEHLLRQIRQQARQLDQVMRTVPQGVLLLDSTGTVVLANPQAERDLMTLADAQVGNSLSRLGDRMLTELLSAPPRGLWHEARAAGRTFEIIARPIATGPGVDSWVLILRDVTEDRDAQQRTLQSERLAAVGQLAAGIAHDFNNILTIIGLDAQLAVAAAGLPVGVRSRLATIREQAQRAADLVRQILDFSRQAVLELRPLALRPFIGEQVALLERTLPESIALELAGTDDDCTISADPSRLQQVVLNLAVNARDAMPMGGRLCFTLARIAELPSDLQSPTATAPAAAGWVRLTVADGGTGISPEALPHVFEPFFTTKGPDQGSGLGLAQIHGIVKLHGGEIGVSTQVGVGTTFTIYLPALAESTATEPESMADRAPAAAGQTILIVEDNPALREALVDIVDLLGYRTVSAANGREALSMLAQHGEIALIMSDLAMPEMGGRELLREVKQRGMTTPMVILSGHPLDEELASLQALGLAGWLLKPPKVEELARLLAQALPAQTISLPSTTPSAD